MRRVALPHRPGGMGLRAEAALRRAPVLQADGAEGRPRARGHGLGSARDQRIPSCFSRASMTLFAHALDGAGAAMGSCWATKHG